MGIFENFKDVLKIADAANNHDLYKKLAELQTSVLALQEENRELKDHVGQLTEQLSLKEKMHFTAPFYWQENDKTPFCSACFDAKSLAIRVVFSHNTDTETRWDCPVCQYMYLIRKGQRYQPPTPGYGSGGPDSWMR
jgi:hypothetical protein